MPWLVSHSFHVHTVPLGSPIVCPRPLCALRRVLDARENFRIFIRRFKCLRFNCPIMSHSRYFHSSQFVWHMREHNHNLKTSYRIFFWEIHTAPAINYKILQVTRHLKRWAIPAVCHLTDFFVSSN